MRTAKRRTPPVQQQEQDHATTAAQQFVAELRPRLTPLYDPSRRPMAQGVKVTDAESKKKIKEMLAAEEAMKVGLLGAEAGVAQGTE